MTGRACVPDTRPPSAFPEPESSLPPRARFTPLGPSPPGQQVCVDSRSVRVARLSAQPKADPGPSRRRGSDPHRALSEQTAPPEATLPGALRLPARRATGQAQGGLGFAHRVFAGTRCHSSTSAWGRPPPLGGEPRGLGPGGPQWAVVTGQLPSRCRDVSLARQPWTALALSLRPGAVASRLRPCPAAPPRRHCPRAASERQARPRGRTCGGTRAGVLGQAA